MTCNKTMLNMDITVQMSDLIPNTGSLPLGEIKLWHFTKKCMDWASAKATLGITLLWDKKYCMATHTSHFKLTQSFVCAQVGVFYWLEIATGLRKTHTNSIFYFSTCGFGALHSQKCYVMFQCYLTKSELWIRFDQVCLFSDFSCLFGVLGPGFASYGSNVYLILE